jgi:hypothetical protein
MRYEIKDPPTLKLQRTRWTCRNNSFIFDSPYWVLEKKNGDRWKIVAIFRIKYMPETII